MNQFLVLILGDHGVSNLGSNLRSISSIELFLYAMDCSQAKTTGHVNNIDQKSLVYISVI